VVVCFVRLLSLFVGEEVKVDPELRPEQEDVRTTRRYTHVSNWERGRVRSPVDELTLKERGGVYEAIEVKVPF
jgi:hypothetical protein